MKTIKEHLQQTYICIGESALYLKQVDQREMQTHEQMIKTRPLIEDSYALLQESTSKTEQGWIG